MMPSILLRLACGSGFYSGAIDARVSKI